MRANLYARITMHTFFFNPLYFFVLQNQRIFWTVLHANTAMNTFSNCIGIMAIQALKAAPLEKYHGSIPGSINKTGLKNFVYLSQWLVHSFSTSCIMNFQTTCQSNHIFQTGESCCRNESCTQNCDCRKKRER